MKKIKLLPVAAFYLITAMLLSSCGIMKNNDFSKQKYTNFKKGESAVTINKVTKENKEADLYSNVSDKKEIAEATTVEMDMPSLKSSESSPAIENEPNKITSAIKIVTKEIKKGNIKSTVSFVSDRLVNKPNTTANNDDGLSVFWVVILILLIIWAIGAVSGGFGLGGLINILLVIALILLILWLLQVV